MSLDQGLYTVGPSDHIDGIATSLQCTRADFEAANPGVDLDHLTANQILHLPHNAVIPGQAPADHACECADQAHTDPSYSADPAQQTVQVTPEGETDASEGQTRIIYHKHVEDIYYEVVTDNAAVEQDAGAQQQAVA